VLTAAWAWVVVSYDPSWNGWLRYAVAAVAVVAVVALVLGRSSRQAGGSWIPRVAVTLAIGTLLLAPGVWSGATAFARTGGSAMAQAGPPNRGFGGVAQQLQQNSNPALREIAGRFAQGQQGRGGPGGMDNARLSDQQRKILAYAESHSNGARLTLAVDGGANAAAAYIINSNAMVTGMGGFSGSDPAPTVQQLATLVRQGQLRFVLLSPRSGPGGDQAGRQPGGTTSEQANGEARGGFGGLFDNGVAQQRQQWVQQSCTIVDPSAYGATAQSSQQDEPGPFGGAQALYECGAK
jgi:hypothetical protein